ncbi:MAG: SDR family NAD(P)-dependent oxidoreductase [Thiomonas sp.]|uniref:Oxidoreductase, short chain dehydrogenase/reductase family protein n=1 Tax=mine drainage metagenome TaxID=410659 RepID=E6PMU7_9ZZZZ
MDKWALVTGASGGIGLEIARELAATGYALVLSARSDDKLQTLAEELRAQHGTRCLCMALDLGAADGPETLTRRIAEAGVEPTVLVNNAGFGVYGRFAEADVAQTQGMIDLNISALTRLTALLLPAMLRQGRGRILNVASTAAFQPGPGMAVYFASKAYVLSLSEALDAELRWRGISVTALCPGATETGFGARAQGEQRSALFHGRMATARDVARYGVLAMERGQRVAVYGLLNRMLAASVRFTPRPVVTALAGWMMREV